jgi:hypothetical protein
MEAPHTPIERLKFRLHSIKQNFLYRNTAPGQTSLARLSDLRDSQRGERCFIIGNGPSLKHTDLTKLRNEMTFGLNRIYLLFPELGFPSTYLVTINKLVIEQCADELLAAPTTKFLPWTLRKYLNQDNLNSTVFIRSDRVRPGFSGDARKPMWAGATVTYAAMQLAYHIGFHEVILIGVDHSFTTQGKPHTAVVSEGDDPNHFAPNYFGKGFKWQLPDLETSEIAYGMAKQAFEADGRRILDATVGGKLMVFEKVDYEKLF